MSEEFKIMNEKLDKIMEAISRNQIVETYQSPNSCIFNEKNLVLVGLCHNINWIHKMVRTRFFPFF